MLWLPAPAMFGFTPEVVIKSILSEESEHSMSARLLSVCLHRDFWEPDASWRPGRRDGVCRPSCVQYDRYFTVIPVYG
jgi:hypothetical protein